MAKKKLVIIAAPTGGNAFDRESARVPVTPEEIAEEALHCRNAGASVIHIHANRVFFDHHHALSNALLTMARHSSNVRR